MQLGSKILYSTAHAVALYRILPGLKYTTEQRTSIIVAMVIGNGTGACAVYNAGFSIKLGHSQAFTASSLTKRTLVCTRTVLHVVPNTLESRLEIPAGIVA